MSRLSECFMVTLRSMNALVRFSIIILTVAPLKAAEEDSQALTVPGVLREQFIYTKAPTPECHASTLCETRKGLVAAWFGGTGEKFPDVGIWTSTLRGKRWSRPQEVADGVQHTALRFPCWNPVLFQPPGNSPTLLFFKVGPDPESWWGEVMVSHDQGKTFTHRRRLPESIDGPVRCKPILLKDGTLLSGSSTEYDGWRVHFERNRLVKGEPDSVWERVGPINDAETFNAIQPTLLTQPDGSIVALCRTKESVIVSTRSTDGGKTWSPLKSTGIPNPNSGVDVVTLKDGRHLLIYNHLASGDNGWGRRGLLNLALSKDGERWFDAGLLEKEKGGEFSYPAIIQTKDGLVHTTYTWHRKRVKHVVIDPKKLKIGKAIH